MAGAWLAFGTVFLVVIALLISYFLKNPQIMKFFLIIFSIISLILGLSSGSTMAMIIGIVLLILGLAVVSGKIEFLKGGNKLLMFYIIYSGAVLWFIARTHIWAFVIGLIIIIILVVLIMIFGGEFVAAGAEGMGEMGELSEVADIAGGGSPEMQAIQQGSKMMNNHPAAVRAPKSPEDAQKQAQNMNALNQQDKDVNESDSKLANQARMVQAHANALGSIDSEKNPRAWKDAKRRYEKAVGEYEKMQKERQDIFKEKSGLEEEYLGQKIKSLRGPMWGFLKVCGILFIIVLIGIALFYPGGASPAMRVNNFMIDMTTLFGNG
ncbi:MAG: hypothetical protein R6U26_01795, partial [Candidatus Undinarchaeales archaeon]